jgi:hypothetical protein
MALNDTFEIKDTALRHTADITGILRLIRGDHLTAIPTVFEWTRPCYNDWSLTLSAKECRRGGNRNRNPEKLSPNAAIPSINHLID